MATKKTFKKEISKSFWGVKDYVDFIIIKTKNNINTIEKIERILSEEKIEIIGGLFKNSKNKRIWIYKLYAQKERIEEVADEIMKINGVEEVKISRRKLIKMPELDIFIDLKSIGRETIIIPETVMKLIMKAMQEILENGSKALAYHIGKKISMKILKYNTILNSENELEKAIRLIMEIAKMMNIIEEYSIKSSEKEQIKLKLKLKRKQKIEESTLKYFIKGVINGITENYRKFNHNYFS